MKKVIAFFLSLLMVIAVVGCTQVGPSAPAAEAPADSQAPAVTDAPEENVTPAPEKAADAGQDAKPQANYPALRQSKDGKSLKIVYLVAELVNESSQRHWQQVQNECTTRGWELTSDTNVSAEYAADPTRTAFQNALAQDPDAIVFSYLDIPPFADLIIEARNKGIGVYAIGTDLVDGMMLNVESSNSVIGAKMMSYAMQRMGGTADVIGFQDLWMPRGIRRDVNAAAVAEKGAYDVGQTIHHAITPEGFTDEMFNVTTDWLTKYGNDIDFVWACWDLGSITIANAMAAKGYTKDDMFTVGIDGGSMSWAYLREGKIPFVASLAEPFEYQVHTTFEAINDLQVKGMNPGDRGCIVPSTRYITTDNMCIIIDESNVPEVGANVHSIFQYYGGKADDPDAWYNKGTPYIVQDYVQ